MKTTTENNKIIAAFMGLSYCTKHQYEGWYKNAEFNERICDFDGLKYHSSWDWLMPVVEKICRTEIVQDDDFTEYFYTRTFGMVNSTTGGIMVRINRCIVFEAATLIEATYLAVTHYLITNT